MTDLRITDEVDQAMVRDMEERSAVGDSFRNAMIPPFVRDDEPEAPAPQPPALDEATIKLLTDLGFDHVPTVEEAKAALDARREKVRDEVLFQADRKGWCEDGTRQVCANLRLKRPGERAMHQITIRASVEYTVHLRAWSQRGALLQARSHAYLPVKAGDRFMGLDTSTFNLDELTVDDTTVELTDDLRKEITNV